MVEVVIDSIRVSLMSQQRIALLKDVDSERYLPIWIGPCEADAITVELQEVEVARPLTHDLLKTIITDLGARVVHIVINDLRKEVYYARIVLERDGQRLEIDSRPSDAIALAVRVHVPIFIDEAVMEKSAIMPEEEVATAATGTPATQAGPAEDRLDAFQDFVDSLNLDDLDDAEPQA